MNTEILNFDEMAMFEGAGMKAGCTIGGLVTGVSAFFVWTGVGAGVFAAALLTSASMGCFEAE